MFVVGLGSFSFFGGGGGAKSKTCKFPLRVQQRGDKGLKPKVTAGVPLLNMPSEACQ